MSEFVHLGAIGLVVALASLLIVGRVLTPARVSEGPSRRSAWRST